MPELNSYQHLYLAEVISLPYGTVMESYVCKSFDEAREDMQQVLVWAFADKDYTDNTSINDNMLASMYRASGPGWHSGLMPNGCIYRIRQVANLAFYDRVKPS